MLKQYFTDGLVQIAIVLSLLRTDLNSYFDHNYVNYPEVQEIILGSSAVLTQTNFHNNPYMNNQFGYQEIYRKHYYDTDHIFQSSLFRDLRSLRHLAAERQDLDIPTFLIVGESSGTIHQEPTDDTGGDVNNNVESQQTLSEELEVEGQNLLNSLEESFEAIAPLLQNLGADPTNEDLSLIEVLWRQDIDLGAGKEVFDPNLRRELEREREIDLQKERQKQKDEELLDRKLKEQQHQNEQQWLAENFTQDGETGEWVPLGGGRPPPPADISVVPDGEQFAFDNIPSLSDELQLQQQQNVNYNMGQQQGTMGMVPQQFQQGTQPSQPLLNSNTQAPSMYNPLQGQEQFGQGSVDDVFTPQPGYNMNNLTGVDMNNTQAFAQPQTAFNNTQVSQNFNQTQGFNNQINNFPERHSLEQTWQDLVNLLDLPQNQSQAQNAINNLTSGGMLTNPVSPLDNLGSLLIQNPVSPVENSSSVLIQNATMPTPAPMNSNMTGFNTTGLVAPRNTDMMRSPAHSSGMVSPGQNFNSTVPGGGALSPLEWDPCSQFLFPNVTGNQSEVLPEDVDKLLPDLITEDDLEEINLADMGLTDAMTPTPTRDLADTSSDSAVSMGSPSLGSPEQNDFSDSAFSPYDGIEGATGGHDDSSRIPKTSKYDPDDFKYGRSCSYSGGDSNSSNFSSTSNDTNGDHGHFGHGGHFGPPSNGHINHNHTYPMKPGADPKDFKRHVYNNNDGKPKHKGPHSRDRKRLQELCIPFTLDQVVDTPVEEFNDMLTRHKLTDPQLQLIRDIRRRGKNKVAAQHCRKRKMDVIDTLEDNLTSLEKMRDKLLHERHMIDKQTREMKEKFGLLYSQIFHSLRDEHGRPYDPSRFSLQQSADGDVFLVPRNYTTDEEYNKKRKGEHE